MTTSMTWLVKERNITVTVDIDEINPTKVYSSLFHFVTVRGQLVPMIAKTNKQEFFQDCTTQISYLATTSFSDQDFFDAIIYAASMHIDKFKRIYLADLWSYINVCMFLLEATKGQFHNCYPTAKEAIILRDAFESNARSGLSNYLIIN